MKGFSGEKNHKNFFQSFLLFKEERFRKGKNCEDC